MRNRSDGIVHFLFCLPLAGKEKHEKQLKRFLIRYIFFTLFTVLFTLFTVFTLFIKQLKVINFLCLCLYSKCWDSKLFNRYIIYSLLFSASSLCLEKIESTTEKQCKLQRWCGLCWNALNVSPSKSGITELFSF